VAYLKSATLRNELIKKFDLQKRYDQEFLFQTREELDAAVTATIRLNELTKGEEI
jgi:hypothetical protein